jgi:thiol-disulfide isomerase/thioredoxin
MLRVYSLFLLPVFLFTEHINAQNSDIVGVTSPEEIRSAHRIFDIYIDRYEPDSTALAYLSNYDDPIDIKILFGTWCHDSKREVPAFIKTMELANNSNFNVHYIGVNREKTDGQGFSEIYNLQYTPTFVILKGSYEIDRIIEETSDRIEIELVEILKSGAFKDH